MKAMIKSLVLSLFFVQFFFVVDAFSQSGREVDYYTSSEIVACPSLAALRKANSSDLQNRLKKAQQLKCKMLVQNTKVKWNGKTIASEHLNTASVKLDSGETLYMYSNYLRSTPYQNPFQTEFLTDKHAILCISPLKLDEGHKAVIAQDTRWLESLGCKVFNAGISVIRIRPYMFESVSEPWQVRVRPKGESGSTLWGYFFAFTLPDGTPVHR